jgi:TfoX/Sxy family transcriptional regulator of competence genes
MMAAKLTRLSLCAPLGPSIDLDRRRRNKQAVPSSAAAISAPPIGRSSGDRRGSKPRLAQPVHRGEDQPMPPDLGLVARVSDVLLARGERGVRQKNVFGGRGFLLGKSTFAIVWGESLLVKTAPEEYAALRAESGVTPFTPGGEKAMSTWLVVSPDTIADDPELAEWIDRALRGVR